MPTRAQELAATITPENLRELWLLDDDQLLQRVKLDLAAYTVLDLAGSRFSFAKLLFPDERARLSFTTRLLVASKQDAPTIVHEYLERFKDRLFDAICMKLDYCGQKKRLAKFFGKVSGLSAIAIEQWPDLIDWVLSVLPLINTILKFKFPISLIIYLLKKAFDKLCECPK